MRYTAERKPATRAKVIDGAARLLRQGDVDKLTISAVMAEAGLTPGGFYAHFRSRDELVSEALVHLQPRIASIFERRTQGLAPVEALRAYVMFYLSLGHRDSKAKGCPVASLAGDAERLSSASRLHLAALAARLPEVLEELLSRLQVDDVAEKASSAASEMVGALLLARATPDPAASELILQRSATSILKRLGGEIVQ